MIRRYQVVLLAAALLLSGCSDKAVIPARKMAAILHDMYVVDAQLEVENSYRQMADTSSVYGAVFASYGYSEEDFNKALDYYLHHPVQFKEVVSTAHKRFEAEVGDRDLDPAGSLFEEIDDPVQKAGRIRSRRRGVSAPSPEEEQ